MEKLIVIVKAVAVVLSVILPDGVDPRADITDDKRYQLALARCFGVRFALWVSGCPAMKQGH